MDAVAKDFFVSYTSADKAWATWIAYILEDDGYTVTIQEWDFRPGSNFAIEMDKALKQSPRMIAVLSPAYLKAPFPASEWAAVFASDPEGAKNASCRSWSRSAALKDCSAKSSRSGSTARTKRPRAR